MIPVLTTGPDPRPATSADPSGPTAFSAAGHGSDQAWLALSVQAQAVSAAVGRAGQLQGQATNGDLDAAAAVSAAPAAPIQAPSSRHALAVIKLALDRAGCSLADLGGLCVADGPGPFTAIRVAMSVIQGIGIGRRLPVIAVPSLAALAWTARSVVARDAPPAASLVLTAIDARMNECYFGAWLVMPGLQPLALMTGGVGRGHVVQPRFEALIQAVASVRGGATGVAEPTGPESGVGEGLPGEGLLLDALAGVDRARLAELADPGNPGSLVLAGSGFRSDTQLADWSATLAVPTSVGGVGAVVDAQIEADAAAVLAIARAPASAAATAWEAMPAAALRPRYVRDKVALDVDEQRRLAAARVAASSRR